MRTADTHPLVARRTMLGGFLAVAGMTLAGCQKAVNSSGGTGRLNVGIAGDISPPNLLQRSQANFPVDVLVFDTLVAIDRKSGNVVPKVAKSWSWNADQTVLTMTLRNDVKFHTGRSFGFKDVQFAIQQVGDEANANQLAPYTKYIKSVQQTGNDEMTVTLTSPVGRFLDLFAIMPLVDSETFSGVKSGEHVVGTGPFVWKSYVPGSQVQLTKNPHYWRSGEPYIDEITLTVFKQGQALRAALLSGQLDAGWGMVPSDATQFAKDSNYNVISAAPVFSDWYIGADVTAEPLTDVRVRQAVAWAVDRDRIVKQVFSGYASPSTLFTRDTFPGLSKADDTRYTYDPGKAKQLLQAAGAVGKSVPMLMDANSQQATAILNIVQYDLQQAGLKVEPKFLDHAAYQIQKAKAAVGGLWIGVLDLASIAIPSLVIGNPPFKVGANTSNITDPEYAKLGKAVIDAKADSAAAAANRAYADYVFEQAFHLTLAHSYIVAVVRKSVTGVNITGTTDLDLSGARTK